MTLASCRQNTCDFNSYIKTIKTVDRPFTFNSAADLDVHADNNRDCDSIFFGKGFRSIGIIDIDKEFYSILLEFNNKIFLATVDKNGHIIDQIELEQNDGVINDSLSIWSTYQLEKGLAFYRTDTIECPGYDNEGNQYLVKKAGTDSIQYLNGKITFK